MDAFISTTYAQLDSPITEVLDELLENGVTSVELGSIHCFEKNVDEKLKGRPFSYLVHNYFPPPSDPFVVNLASANKEIRDRSIKYAQECISIAAAIGAELYTFHPGFISDPIGRSTDNSNYDFLVADTVSSKHHYEYAFEKFLDATNILCSTAKSEGIAIAVETQGSISRSDNILFHHPEEVERFITLFTADQVGLNVNLGHLNLSAQYHKFDKLQFINRFADRIRAFELSHNDGVKDDHALLQKNGWYWPVIKEPKYKKIYKIFEGRDLKLKSVIKMFGLINQLSKENE